MPDEDFELIDSENYRGGQKGETFSHNLLVMRAIDKCRDNGSVEMREGYYNIKYDKFGNRMEIYIPDTRLTFIETVESAMMMMADDIEGDKDDKINNKIKEIKEKLETKRKNYVELEKKEWEKANYNIKQQWLREGKRLIPEVLTEFFPYYNYYILDKVKAYREIVSELKKLTFRKDYYREEWFEA